MNPLEDIENKKGMEDLGRMAVNFYRGAKDETDNWLDAFWTTVAYFTAFFRNAQGNEPKDDES